VPPAFAKDFPSDPALDALVAAFDRGDFGRVRRDGAKLVSGAAPSEVKAAARVLVARTGADPLSIVLFALTAGLLVFLAGYWWWKAGGLGAG
jgi:hypothetical protein